MFSIPSRPAVPQVNISPLAPFIERSTELSKKDVLKRCAGQVEIGFLQKLMLTQFCRIGKNENGSLYLL
jgi:hypothetical protein